ncbi:MAG: chorismate-binding protein [Pseudomonas sp.]|nr:chorismate-binding protein [Pseudomonas sp.]
MTPTDELDPRPIDAQAASWFSRNRNQPSRQERKAFALWMQTPEHTRAYRQFEQLWDDLAALKQANRPVPLPVRRTPRWRPALAAAAALLCAVRVEDNLVTVRPIAGTRPRGATEEADRALEDDLLSDDKEIAEHLMLIDLGRNDVGRVSATGSVRLTEKMVIERYSNVMHIVSNVTGQLDEGLTAMDALRAILPAGTLSGAPKIRAMEIIDELEPVKRGVYGGAVGYFAWNGNMDTAIAIRTAVIKDGELHVQAGGGIVADSVPALEWEETINKRRAMFRAVALAEQTSK